MQQQRLQVCSKAALCVITLASSNSSSGRGAMTLSAIAVAGTMAVTALAAAMLALVPIMTPQQQ